MRRTSMPPSDLDGRLRRALSHPGEPVPSEESLGLVEAALTRRRARRRTVLGATGMAVLVVFGLTFGLLVGLRSPSTTTAAQSPGVASGRSTVTDAAKCVELQIGTGPTGCVGRITSVAENGTEQAGPSGDASLEPKFAQAQGQASSTVVPITTGTRVTVSLPNITSGSWDRVGIYEVGLTQQNAATDASHALPTHRDAASGVTVAVLSHATSGRFVLFAMSSGTCATPAPSCAQTARQWSITLNVR
jgi:hypothetical protein